MNENPQKEFAMTPLRAFIAFALLTVFAACSSVFEPQDWDEAFGPVIPHDTFPADCSLCHVSGDWHELRADFAFDHEKETGVALEGAHAEASCILCHNDRGPVEIFSVKGCAGCHEDIHRGTLGQTCMDCHNQDTWQPREQILAHDKTRFPLIGAHAAAACFTCHEGAQTGNFEGLDIACESCHNDQLAATRSPNHLAIGWVQNCQECHTPTTWKAAHFDHPANFPLDGAHGALQCYDCHDRGNLQAIDPDCASCHLDDFQNTNTPNHASVGFSTSCLECHTPTTWTATHFRHPASFPLVGGHSDIDCAECHNPAAPGPVPVDCAECHLDDYEQTTNPDHRAVGFPTDCAQCHGATRWDQAMFNHPATFPLAAGHGGLDCTACHTPGQPGDLPTECVACHEPDYREAADPNHVAAGFPTDCAQCHTPTMWEQATFAHPATFPLTAGHGGLDCAQCHMGSIGALPTDCFTCHEQEYREAAEPNHVAAGFPTDCAQCHTATAWDQAIFAHPRTFPLAGGHGGLDCAQCHMGSIGPLPTDCVACHEPDYQATTDPNHVVAGFPTDCTQCHNTTMWDGAMFMHPGTFPLSGGHADLDCTVCHVGGIGPLSTDCADCHLTDYQNTTDPNHVNAGFPTDCAQCHTTTMWDGALFMHPASFPLTGGHADVDCAVCHVGGAGSLSTDCADCHLTDYQNTTDPNHANSGFPTDCTQCHNTAMWEGANFTHPASFPLSGGHADVECAVCHVGGIGPLSTDCVDCHLTDYQRTDDPNHGNAGFPTDCMQCHTTTIWEDAMFTHPASFPLTGGHGGVDCAQCHVAGAGSLSTDCVDCHLADYQNTDDPNHAASGFPTDCTQCHTTATWEGAMFMHPASFPLTAGHADIDCAVCHVGGIGPLSTDCVDCHLADYQRTDDPSHVNAGFPTDCTQCHTTTMWDGAIFSHPASFPLSGGHGGLDCAQCHLGGIGPLSTDCVDCHLTDYQNADDPNHAASGFPTDCTQCHTTSMWEGAMFMHPASFPLTAGHTDIDCAVCHVGGIGPLSSECVDCHLTDFQGAGDPNHVAAGFPADCTQCHNTSGWENATFSHPASFPLTAAHSGLECVQCHVGSLGPLPTDCVACHLSEYQQATDPNHNAAGFPTDCTQCHTATSWDNAMFTHPSSFPLSAGHSGLDCAACHRGGIGPLSADCVDCHLFDFQRTTDPNHLASGFPSDCTQCHTVAMWEGAIFNHPARFPLTGGHGGLDCAQCHVGGVGPLQSDCIACHLPDYQQATDPNHATAGFPTDCTQCHQPTTWDSATFTHPASFPLTAGHSGVDCAQCHQGVLGPVSIECIDCHQTDYQTATDPNHAQAGFPTDCTQCHNTTMWDGATFNHPASFPLTGGHSGVDCAQCHMGGLGSLPTECVSCHQSDYQGANDPNHASAGFPTDCTQCHTATSWDNAMFNHPSSFPLTGGHSGVDCAQCHMGSIGSLPTECFDCHQSDYQTATAPNHAQSGFPTDCAQCHTVTTWDNATFNHPSSFPLMGGHSGVDCAQCHQGGIGPLPTECVTCHQQDYQQTTDPNHSQAGFSTDCAACHNTTMWEGAVFNHAFPINSGAHRNLDCIDCHTTPGNQTTFSCTHCHEHQQSQTDRDHREVSGYTWSSPACYECHPRGRH